MIIKIEQTKSNLKNKTAYDIVENISNSVIPMKWVVTGEQKSLIFNIFDNADNYCGKFYKLTNGFFDTKYVIEYGNYALKSYEISVGKTRNILIYKDDYQIADFTVFFDYQNYSNSGEIVANKEEVRIGYTYDKNNKFFDKNWISNHFKKQDVDSINNQILEHRKDIVNKMKKQAKYTVNRNE